MVLKKVCCEGYDDTYIKSTNKKHKQRGKTYYARRTEFHQHTQNIASGFYFNLSVRYCLSSLIADLGCQT